jgi:hypothetical protein
MPPSLPAAVDRSYESVKPFLWLSILEAEAFRRFAGNP